MRSILALFILSFMMIGAGCSMTIRHAFAQEEQLAPIGQPTTPPDHVEGHAQHHDVYRTWCQPGREKPCPSYYSCCNEKKDGVGDCYPTTAELRNDHWFALTDEKKWIEIPDEKIVREINPDETGSRAHLCEAYGKVLCFVPPFGGG